MKRQLRERRDRVAERHDAALARYPTRGGAAFERELRAIVEELSAVSKTADTPSSDPVEVAKTYRWLGDAFFDLGRGKDNDALMRGSVAYQRAEELYADAESPVEKAKLDAQSAVEAAVAGPEAIANEVAKVVREKLEAAQVFLTMSS